MAGRTVYPVEALPMNRLLWKHKSDLAGIIIRLAWKAGLKRDEIHALTWEQIDWANSAITPHGRSVPIDEDTKASLRLWSDVLAAKGVASEYVVASPRTKAQLDPALITNTAQRAMRKAGIEKLRLEDLRCDYIARMRDAHGDVYAMRVSGMSIQTYSSLLGVPIAEIAAASSEDTNFTQRIWELLQQYRSGSVAIALWLSQEMFMSNKEIIALTWDDIDLSRGTVRVGAQTRYLLKEIITMLKEERDRRGEAGDAHVILSPNTNAPMSQSAFSAMLRDVMVKNGLGGIYIGEVKEKDRKMKEIAQIRRYAEENGFISGRDAVQTLGVRKRVVYDRLRQLVDSGELVRSGVGYVPRDRFIPRERWADTVLARVDADGGITIAKTAELLHIARYRARLLLLEMEEQNLLTGVKNNREFVRSSAKSN